MNYYYKLFKKYEVMLNLTLFKNFKMLKNLFIILMKVKEEFMVGNFFCLEISVKLYWTLYVWAFVF